MVGRNTWDLVSGANPESCVIQQFFSLGDGSIHTSCLKFLADLVIQTSAGPVTVRRHWVHVLDVNMPEVLLGRPLLLVLGIDVEKMVTVLGSQHVDIVDDTQYSPYHESEKDTMDSGCSTDQGPSWNTGDDESVTFGTFDDSELDIALNQMVE